MKTNLNLFDGRPVALARESDATGPEPITTRDDVVRTITHKRGRFREIVDGATTGREYVLVELIDGRLMKQFTDGTREAMRLNPEFVAYQLRIRVFVEACR